MVHQITPSRQRRIPRPTREPQQNQKLRSNFSHRNHRKSPYILPIILTSLKDPTTDLTHLKRAKTWQIAPYPCVGIYLFIELHLHTTPSYPSLISRLQNGAVLLDIGCFLGQDSRKLVHDGAPASSIYGCDLTSTLFDAGFALFNDKEIFDGQFFTADVLSKQGVLALLKGKIDIINSGYFLHLFDYDTQISVCEKMVGLLEGSQEAMVVGHMTADVTAGTWSSVKGLATTELFKHYVESFERLWREVGERTGTGTEWAVWARMEGFVEGRLGTNVGFEDIHFLQFEVRRVRVEEGRGG